MFQKVLLDFFLDTVAGSEIRRFPVEVARFSHYLLRFPKFPENNGRSNYLTTNYQPQLVNSRRMVSQLPPAVPTGKGVLWGKNVVHLAAVTLVDPWKTPWLFNKKCITSFKKGVEQIHHCKILGLMP